jgi:hypothetical protein
MNPKSAFWQFELKYGVGFLGGLYLLILIEKIYFIKFYISNGVSDLDSLGIWMMLLDICLVLFWFCIWLYVMWKSWRLTFFSKTYRTAALGSLLLVPVLLLWVGSQLFVLALKLIR